MAMTRLPKAKIGILALLVLSGIASARLDEIVLEDFANAVHEWKEMNDPVMGGQSTGTFHKANGVGVFHGVVKDVPFLHAPGFIQVRTTDTVTWPDVTTCHALQLQVRSADPYTGYRVSFGTTHAPGGKFYARGYKANLPTVSSSSSDDFEMIEIAFSEFTDFWDDATGEPIHTCKENELYCPDTMTLKNLKTMAFWGEGVNGKVSLEIKSVRAVGCAE